MKQNFLLYSSYACCAVSVSLFYWHVATLDLQRLHMRLFITIMLTIHYATFYIFGRAAGLRCASNDLNKLRNDLRRIMTVEGKK